MDDKNTNGKKNGQDRKELFRQSLLFSLLFIASLVMAMNNFSEPIDPFVMRKDVQELENIEVYKPPSKTIQIPEVKPPAQMVQTAPEVSESEEAIETIDVPSQEYVELEGGGDEFENLGTLGGEETESDETIPPQKVSVPEPVTPPGVQEFMEQTQESLTCSVGIYVSADGQVLRVRIINSTGRSDADNAALEAARKSQWEPAMQNGRPIAREVAVTYRFNYTQ
ncbi:MAG: TonB family protein [Candidatus Coatesbacteria bacterium]|nr:TonB family protein [Candidatus Coatesbacteria bacterium]